MLEQNRSLHNRNTENNLQIRGRKLLLGCILLILSNWAELESGSANAMQESESIHLSKYKNTTLLYWSDFPPYATSKFPIIGRQNEKIQVLILFAALCRQTTASAWVSCQKSQSKSLTKRVKPAFTYSQSELGCWHKFISKDIPGNSPRFSSAAELNPIHKKAQPFPTSAKKRGGGRKDRYFLLLLFQHTPHIQADRSSSLF